MGIDWMLERLAQRFLKRFLKLADILDMHLLSRLQGKLKVCDACVLTLDEDSFAVIVHALRQGAGKGNALDT